MGQSTSQSKSVEKVCSSINVNYCLSKTLDTEVIGSSITLNGGKLEKTYDYCLNTEDKCNKITDCIWKSSNDNIGECVKKSDQSKSCIDTSNDIPDIFDESCMSLNCIPISIINK